MHHWKVKFTRRGFEPPRPFGRTSMVVCAKTREEAKEKVDAAPGYKVTASKTTEKVSFTQRCHCVSTEGTDVRVENHGSVFSIDPITQAAKDWLAKNVEAEAWQWQGSRLVIDHRFAGDLVRGMQNAGLTVE